MSTRVWVPGGDGAVSHTVIFGHWLPRVLGADAVTIGARIYVRGDVLSPRLHAHEYAHTLQGRRYGVPTFLVRYVGEMGWRVVQQLVRGNWSTTFAKAHHAHSLERKAELFARLRYPDFAEVKAP